VRSDATGHTDNITSYIDKNVDWLVVKCVLNADSVISSDTQDVFKVMFWPILHCEDGFTTVTNRHHRWGFIFILATIVQDRSLLVLETTSWGIDLETMRGILYEENKESLPWLLFRLSFRNMSWRKTRSLKWSCEASLRRRIENPQRRRRMHRLKCCFRNLTTYSLKHYDHSLIETPTTFIFKQWQEYDLKSENTDNLVNTRWKR
jgi:hypothetical protein